MYLFGKYSSFDSAKPIIIFAQNKKVIMTNEEEQKKVNQSVFSDETLSLSQKKSTESELLERVTKLEEKLDQVLILLSDIYRYENLRDLLAREKWREADQETAKVMLEVSGKTDKENLTPDDVIKFPCSVIGVIDQLWTKYSKGRFGFSVQQKIYANMGGTDDISQIDMKILNATGEQFGWRLNNKWIPYEKLDFSIKAPAGSFPVAWWDSPYGAKLAVYFLARLKACKI